MSKRGKDDKFASIIKVQNYMNEEVRIRFTGGRQVIGIVKGYDTINNLILDDTIEQIRDPSDPYRLSEATRKLGLIFVRGTMIYNITPTKNLIETDDPFQQQEEANSQYGITQ